MNLLILESPNKAETIRGYLKEYSDWKIIATNGHYRNLKEKEMSYSKSGETYKADFIIEKKKIYENLKRSIETSTHIYIATDEDREGEAIAFDIIEDFKLSPQRYTRVVFSEISKKLIIQTLIERVAEGEINKSLVDARYSRRLIDRIVGYKLSPLLKFIFKEDKEMQLKGIGRVSYAALAILTKRESEIIKFDAYYYRKINATYKVEGKEIYCTSEKKYIEGEDDDEFYEDLNALSTQDHIVTEFDTEFVDETPPKPVIFSSLMSNIFYLYKYTTEETARVAQRLFEGVYINGKKMGLITYIRTDSYRISDEVAQEAGELIPYIVVKEDDGPLGFDYLAIERREYKNRAGAQDAHEAIRPVHLNSEFAPHNIRKHLSEEEFRVYDYIYKITLSSFMANSSYIKTKVTLICDEIKLKSESKEQVFDGWETIGKYYVPFYNKFDTFQDDFPNLYINDTITPREVNHWSRKAKAPERYGEGRFIETLTTKGIGRPSTLPVIIPELIKKEYVKSHKGMLTPTSIAMKLVNWAQENASWIVDSEHARGFEDTLSKIENEEVSRDEIINEYDKLMQELFDTYNFKTLDEYKKERPSHQQINTLRKLQSKGVSVPESAFNMKMEATKFLKSYFDSQKVCKCRYCKDGEILEFNERYSCNNKECDFTLWKNRVDSFIDNFKIQMDKKEFSVAILKKQKELIEDMEGKSAIFSANVFIEKTEKYGYGISFKVYKKRK